MPDDDQYGHPDDPDESYGSRPPDDDVDLAAAPPTVTTSPVRDGSSRTRRTPSLGAPNRLKPVWHANRGSQISVRVNPYR